MAYETYVKSSIKKDVAVQRNKVISRVVKSMCREIVAEVEQEYKQSDELKEDQAPAALEENKAENQSIERVNGEQLERISDHEDFHQEVNENEGSRERGTIKGNEFFEDGRSIPSGNKGDCEIESDLDISPMPEMLTAPSPSPRPVLHAQEDDGEDGEATLHRLAQDRAKYIYCLDLVHAMVGESVSNCLSRQLEKQTIARDIVCETIITKAFNTCQQNEISRQEINL